MQTSPTRPVVRHLWRLTVVALAMALATVGFPAAANAAVACTPTAYAPTRYVSDSGVLVSTGGMYACASSVERIRIIVNVYRDGSLVQTSDYTADRRPPNKLLNVLSYLAPNCVPGTYVTTVEGWSYTKDAWGLLLNSHSGTSSAPTAIPSC